MPVWLLTLLFQLVLKLGLPALIEWIKSKFPRFSKVVEKAKPVLQEYLDDVNSGMSKKEAQKKAKENFKKECTGIGCPMDVK